ncbi:MAG: insulinase family protein [Candidatus Moduliflexus flocculans]|nr:insulinase family protein [Candidatus Moduliflexus flocculans]
MKLTEAEIAAFHRAYYVPNNAVLAIVGNIDAVRTKELVGPVFRFRLPGRRTCPSPPRPALARQSDAVVRTARDRPRTAPASTWASASSPSSRGDLSAPDPANTCSPRARRSRLRSRLLKKDTDRALPRRLRGRAAERRRPEALLPQHQRGHGRARPRRPSSRRSTSCGRTPSRSTRSTGPSGVSRADYLEKPVDQPGQGALPRRRGLRRGRPSETRAAELDKYLGVGPLSVQAFVGKYFIPQNRVVLELRRR